LEKKKLPSLGARPVDALSCFAESCGFGVQDYSQQRPSQELVAKDLHGTEWRFRHIYRGTSTYTTSSIGSCTVYWFTLNPFNITGMGLKSST
jgi:hypothetical protein